MRVFILQIDSLNQMMSYLVITEMWVTDAAMFQMNFSTWQKQVALLISSIYMVVDQLLETSIYKNPCTHSIWYPHKCGGDYDGIERL